MTHIERTIDTIEAFLNTTEEGSIQTARANFRDMFLKSMKNFDPEDEIQRVGDMTEAFLFIDNLMESLLTVPASEVEDLGILIRKNRTNPLNQ